MKIEKSTEMKEGNPFERIDSKKEMQDEKVGGCVGSNAIIFRDFAGKRMKWIRKQKRCIACLRW